MPTLIGRSTHWDEPPGATTPRGWWYPATISPRGFYLDYGPDHYRSPHLYCSPGHECAECEPGSVLACRYPDGPGARERHESRWFTTIAQARLWIETGRIP